MANQVYNYMRVFFQVLLLLCTLPFSVFAATPGEVMVGDVLRDLTLNGFNGQTRIFSDFRGKPLIINVWASWCGPCKTEMASLERLAQRYNGKQLNIIGVSTDDYVKAAEAFIKDTEISFENFLDSQLRLENMLGANRIPLTILVDKKGTVLVKVRGAYNWDNPQTIQAIAKEFKLELN